MRLDVVTDNRFDQGWELIVALDVAGVPVKAAFWAQVGESGEWRLYIVSPIVDEEGPLQAYSMVQSVLPKLKPTIGPSIHKLGLLDISVVGLESRLFKDMKSRVPGAIRKTAKKLAPDLEDLTFLDEKLIYKLG
jgi:hypothetical protein